MKIKKMRIINNEELIEVDVIDSFVYNEFYTVCLTSYPKNKWTKYAVSDYLTGARIGTLKIKKNWKEQIQPMMKKLTAKYPTGAAFCKEDIMPVNSERWFSGYLQGIEIEPKSHYYSGLLFGINQNKIK